ncbi:MAG: Protein kinase, partial [Acidobacteria bacterium]|nr:Protein kinase [Acidobacteriota bacterium]
GMLVGTPAYMSPEQVRGTRVDARSDLYSLAVLTYEALTGTRPAAHGSVAATLLAVLSESLPAPSTLIGGLAPQVDAAFAHALAKDPDHRPSDVEAWAVPLATVLEPAPAERRGWPTLPPAGP